MASTRNHTFQFRVGDAEREHLRQAAVDAGYESASAYVRDVVLNRIVVVANHTGVVVIPGTETPEADDQRVLDVVTRAVEAMNSAQDREPAAVESPQALPAAEPVELKPAPPASAPDPASTTSPGGGGELVGSGASHEPPVAAATAGSIPGPGETVRGREGLQAAPGELEPGGPGACPGCGGTDGRHQSFCEKVTGEPPVTGTEAPTELPEAPAVIESHEEYVARRIAEGESAVVAEAEWRQRTSGQAPVARQTGSNVTCRVCGTVSSSTTVACPDCGSSV